VARRLRLFLGLRKQDEDAEDQGKCEQDTPHRDLRKLNGITNPEAYQIDDVRRSRASYSGFPQKPLTENDGADLENLLLWVNHRLPVSYSSETALSRQAPAVPGGRLAGYWDWPQIAAFR
jgi:hypothetical protein